jgi:hypothetical protein
LALESEWPLALESEWVEARESDGAGLCLPPASVPASVEESAPGSVPASVEESAPGSVPASVEESVPVWGEAWVPAYRHAPAVDPPLQSAKTKPDPSRRYRRPAV